MFRLSASCAFLTKELALFATFPRKRGGFLRVVSIDTILTNPRRFAVFGTFPARRFAKIRQTAPNGAFSDLVNILPKILCNHTEFYHQKTALHAGNCVQGGRLPQKLPKNGEYCFILQNGYSF
ncbi:MAG: hypothetical protein IJP14_01510 [Clostridia bacterium]|nr:hypothetical protein [Clostridia bacterium]